MFHVTEILSGIVCGRRFVFVSFLQTPPIWFFSLVSTFDGSPFNLFVPCLLPLLLGNCCACSYQILAPYCPLSYPVLSLTFYFCFSSFAVISVVWPVGLFSPVFVSFKAVWSYVWGLFSMLSVFFLYSSIMLHFFMCSFCSVFCWDISDSMVVCIFSSTCASTRNVLLLTASVPLCWCVECSYHANTLPLCWWCVRSSILVNIILGSPPPTKLVLNQCYKTKSWSLGTHTCRISSHF